jgi:hypothetical protein
VAKPIKVQLTQGTTTPTNKVCTIEVISRNTFLDAYHVNVLRGGSKLRIIVRLTDRFVILEVEYQVSLTKVGIHLVSLQKLQETLFLILMHVDEFNAKSKAKWAKFWPTFISNITNNFLDILTNELPIHLFLSHNVGNKIKPVLRSTPPSKSPYRLNKKELQ